MKDIAVIYESKYGATEKYANWIREDLDADLLEKRKINIKDLKTYNTIVYGGGLYGGGVSGLSLLTKNYEEIKDKNIIVFTCGLADTKDEANVSSIRNSLDKVLPPEMKDNITVFHLRGAIDYKNLSIIHKAMMAMLKTMLSKKDEDSLRNEDKEMLATYGSVVDFTDNNTIKPLVEYVKNL